jgi:hypothetical protein
MLTIGTVRRGVFAHTNPLDFSSAAACASCLLVVAEERALLAQGVFGCHCGTASAHRAASAGCPGPL